MSWGERTSDKSNAVGQVQQLLPFESSIKRHFVVRDVGAIA